MKPRPYQKEALQAIWSALQERNCVLLEACCSAGKTLIFSKIIKRLLAEQPDFRVLILMDREILVRQTEDKLRKVAPELAFEIGIVCASASKTKDHTKRVTIASRQTLINRMDDFEPVQLVVIDEAHMVAIPKVNKDSQDQFNKILDKLFSYNKNMRLLAVTATPYRLAGGYIYGGNNVSGSEPYFSDISHRITVKELQDQGYLAPLIGYTTAPGTIRRELDQLGIIAGEYNLGQLSGVMTKSVHIKSAVEAWQEHCIVSHETIRKKTLAFCVDINHAEMLSDSFNEAGIPAIAIHSQLSDIENMQAMEALEHGTKKVFCSVAKLTTGMDIVDIDCILMCRPTKSAALYKQILGRGQRLNMDTHPHKKDCLVLDMVGNNDTFGTDLDKLKVTYAGQGKKQEKKTEKFCPECNKSLHPACRVCPCGYAYPTSEFEEAEKKELEAVAYGEADRLPAVNMPIMDIRPQLWESKKSGKTLLRVIVEMQESDYRTCSASLWLCFPDDGYSGFAVERGIEQWYYLTGKQDNGYIHPISAAEAEARWADEFVSPSMAIVDINGQWPDIIGFEYGHVEQPGQVDDDDDDIPF